MRNIKLLDCTLRDGGYLNDWEFGHSNLISVFERLVNADIDIIEIGFLDERRKFDVNRSIMPSTDCAERIYGKIDKRNALIVGMIDYGTCSLSQIQPCDESYIDGIRVIFKKQLMHEAMEFCRQIKALGYKVFSQMVSITSYSDEELNDLISLANDIKPFAVSMVDTYGLLYKDNLLHYFQYLDKGLDKEIGLGYHSHNNFQLAYSNCMEVLRHQTERQVVVDGTLYGMGKSAGNAPIELLAMNLNEQYGKKYDISQMLEAIDGNIMKFYQKMPWGYNMFFYLAASNKCHPSYVKSLMDKHTLSVKSINEILDKIEEEKKLMFDQKYIEGLYFQYQATDCDDTKDKEALTQLLCGQNIMLIGPGSNIEHEHDKIKQYIKEHNPVVISINFIPSSFDVNYVFLSNPRRYIHLLNALKEEKNKSVKVIATSNVTKAKGKFAYTLNNSELLDQKAEVVDYSFIMLLKVLQNIGIIRLSCAGLDGYSEKGENYVEKDMEYWFACRNAHALNQYVKEYLQSVQGNLEVDFVTKSRYVE